MKIPCRKVLKLRDSEYAQIETEQEARDDKRYQSRKPRHKICEATNRHGSPNTNHYKRWQNRKIASAKAAKQQSQAS